MNAPKRPEKIDNTHSQPENESPGSSEWIRSEKSKIRLAQNGESKGSDESTAPEEASLEEDDMDADLEEGSV